MVNMAFGGKQIGKEVSLYTPKEAYQERKKVRQAGRTVLRTGEILPD
jgi:hypothetical protein